MAEGKGRMGEREREREREIEEGKEECGIVLSDAEGGKGGGRVRLEGCKRRGMQEKRNID